MENAIGKEVKTLIDNAYAKAQKILVQHIDKLHELATLLIEKEVIEQDYSVLILMLQLLGLL